MASHSTANLRAARVTLPDELHEQARGLRTLHRSVGVRWADGKVTTSLKVTNLANEDVQQHVFGDILKRQVVGEMRVQF